MLHSFILGTCFVGIFVEHSVNTSAQTFSHYSTSEQYEDRFQ